MSASLMRYAPGALLLALCLPGLMIDRPMFWAAYLSAWCFCTGIAMGALGNVWIHNLTGGRWGEAIRSPCLQLGRTMPLLALLFVPVLFALGELYPWAAGTADGVARWSGELSSPQFKSAWLSPWFFAVRSVVYLALWVLLERLTRHPRWTRSRPFSAAAIIVYWVSASLAAIDWMMSLMPTWYSSAFPPLVVTGQMLGGFAAGLLAAALGAKVPAAVFRDLGNLMLMYVMSWAYLAFTQYLIIWAENLPHEIGWFIVRLHTSWYWVGWVLVGAHFFIPLLVLLSRDAKEAPRVMAILAAALLVLHLVDVWWIVVPSVRPESAHVWWLAPLAAAAMVGIVAGRVRSTRLGEATHA